MRKYMCLFLLFLFIPLKSWAAEALVGHYMDHTGAPVTVLALNDGRARIDLSPEVFLLLEGQNIWVIASYEEGEWHKNDFVELTTEAIAENPGMLYKYSRVTVKDTGYGKDIAGYAGKTFQVNVKGTGESYIVTVSNHKDVARLSKVVMVLFRDFTLAPGGRDVMEAINTAARADYGVLNLDRELTLQKIERKEYDESYFKVPAGL